MLLRLLVSMVAVGISTAAFADRPPALIIDGDTVESVRSHFDRGAVLYRAGRYAEAVLEFEAARALEDIPAIDYDLALLYDRMGRAREAADAYGRFVAAVPGDRDAPAVRARIAELRRQVASSAPIAPALAPAPAPAFAPVPASAAIAPASPPAPESANASPRRHIYPWIVGGAGASLLAGALVAGLVAHARYIDLKSNCAPDGACDAATVPSAQRWIDEGRGAGLASDVLLGVGAITAAIGVVLYFVEGHRRAEEQRRVRVAPVVDARGGGLMLGGAW